MSLKDLFFVNDSESEETKMSEELKNEAAASENKEGNLVTPDMLVGDIITKHPLAAQFLMECGMGCIHCPASQMETIEEAYQKLKAHHDANAK